MKNNELVTINENTGFLQLADFNLDEAMASELDGLDMTFERIKIPSAGSTVFEVPGENPGEPDTVKEFSAVILYHHPLYAYYKDKYTGGSNPPDCGSFDGVTGEGDPGGSCAKCPYNQFGSGGKTAAKLARTAAGYMYCVKGGDFPVNTFFAYWIVERVFPLHQKAAF